MKKTIIIGVMGVVVPFVLSGCGSNEQVQGEMNNVGNVVEKQEGVDTGAVEEKGFDELFFAFNEPYKKALFATGKAEDSSVALIERMLSKWGVIEKVFGSNQPEAYAQTQDWEIRIQNIGNLLKESHELAQNGQLEESHEKLEEVRAEFRTIRNENNIVLLTDLMLVFHDTMEEIVEEGSQKDVTKLTNLKEEITPLVNWDELTDDTKYQTMVKELEIIVNNLNNFTGEEYNEELKKIKPAFIKLYLQFG